MRGLSGVVFLVTVLWTQWADAGYSPQSRAAPGFSYDGALGNQCEYDEDCITAHSYCRSNRVCDCKKKYQYDQNTDTCYPTQLGLRCHDDSDCVMENSRCHEETCQCRQGHVAADATSSCLPSSRLQAACQEDLQCQAADPNSHCNITTRTCDCNVAFHAAWDTQQCTPNKRIREICTSHASCASVPDQQDKVECRPDNDGRSKCFCRSGFSEQNNICAKGYNGGSPSIAASLSFIVFSVIIHNFRY